MNKQFLGFICLISILFFSGCTNLDADQFLSGHATLDTNRLGEEDIDAVTDYIELTVEDVEVVVEEDFISELPFEVSSKPSKSSSKKSKSNKSSGSSGSSDSSPEPTTPVVCGDGIIEGDEKCDGSDLNGTTCVSQGFDGGTLACSSDCVSLDTSNCTTDVVDNDDCIIGFSPTFRSVISNTGDWWADFAVFDESGSSGTYQNCLFQSMELVELSDTGDVLCSGPLILRDWCSFTGTPCNAPLEIGSNVKLRVVHNDGRVAHSEPFAFGITVDMVTESPCDSDVVDVCGDGTVGVTEECDGTNLGGASCVTEGLPVGSLACFADCTLDTSGCTSAGSIPDGEEVNATMDINVLNDVHPFSDDIRGVNMGGWWTFFYNQVYPADSPKLMELTKLIKPGVLRHQGGLSSNDIMWDRFNDRPYASTDWRDQRYHLSTANPDLMIGWDRCTGGDPVEIPNAYRFSYQADEMDYLNTFAEYVGGADIMVEVDITTCDPDMWADMVKYVNVDNSYGVKYWELGNELDLVRTQGGTDMPLGEEYVRRYKLYTDAMKAVDPSIEIVGPGTASGSMVDGSYFNPYGDFFDPLTADSGVLNQDMLGAFSYHRYPMWNRAGGEMTFPAMLDWSSVDGQEYRSRSVVSGLVSEKRAFLDARGFDDTLIAITEFNSMAADVPNDFVYNHAGAIYVADMLGRFAYGGADMIMFWELNDAATELSFGLIDTAGSIEGSDNYYPVPVYYSYFMYAQFFGDMLVESSTSRVEDLTMWASTDSDDPGKLKIMVVNLRDGPTRAALSLNGFAAQSGEYFEMTNPTFVAANDVAKKGIPDGTMINDLEIDAASAATIISSAQAIIDSGRDLSVTPGATSVEHVFPAYSATVLVLSS